MELRIRWAWVRVTSSASGGGRQSLAPWMGGRLGMSGGPWVTVVTFGLVTYWHKSCSCARARERVIYTDVTTVTLEV